MRKEAEVIEMILRFAVSRESIRAVVLNGSRVNSNAPKDDFRDYDVIFFVKDLQRTDFKQNRKWIDKFGELVIMQHNNFSEGYIFMMQYKDGVRIDLNFCDLKHLQKEVKKDSLTKVLLDKDDLLGKLTPPNDRTYHIKKPTEKEFSELVNEAWWIQLYVVKGICRDELIYTKYMYDVILMDSLRKLMSWKIGFRNKWQINAGKCGKWFKRLLPKKEYEEFIQLYPKADYENIWNCLSQAGKFIHKTGKELAVMLDYDYPEQDDKNVIKYIQEMKRIWEC